jgi:hypothetical protein
MGGIVMGGETGEFIGLPQGTIVQVQYEKVGNADYILRYGAVGTPDSELEELGKLRIVNSSRWESVPGEQFNTRRNAARWSVVWHLLDQEWDDGTEPG